MAAPKRPSVTVLMPVYNGGASLVPTVQSVLRQTFRDLEFIIVDDGSTDKTPELLRKLARQDKRIKILRNEPNQGIVRSLNRGLKAARGSLIARVDCGDLCDPRRLKLQVDHFREHPECALLGTQVDRVDEAGKVVGHTDYPQDDAGIRRELFCRKSVIAHPSAMYRRVPGLTYRENAYPAEDYDYWLRLAEKGGVAILPQRLVRLVNDPASISHKNMVKQVKIVKRIRDLLLERLRDGKESSELPNYRKIDHWWWSAATWLYGSKVRRGYYGLHPMNFLVNAAMVLLCPATLVPRTPLLRLVLVARADEFKRFLSSAGKSHGADGPLGPPG